MRDEGNEKRTGERNDLASRLTAWLVVGLPLAWGIGETLKKSLALFR